MAWPPVAQALTTAMLWPRMPYSMATWPDGESGSICGMRNGDTRRAPRSTRIIWFSSSRPIPPIHVTSDVAVVAEEPGVPQRLTGGCDREVRRAVMAPGVLRVHVVRGVEALH